MLDQNTDRMWYVIGAVIIGAAIILILNGTMPQIFASVADTFSEKTNEVTSEIYYNMGNENPNLYTNGDHYWKDVATGIGSTMGDRPQSVMQRNIKVEPGTTYEISYEKLGDSPWLMVLTQWGASEQVTHNSLYSNHINPANDVQLQQLRADGTTVSTGEIYWRFTAGEDVEYVSLTTGNVAPVKEKFGDFEVGYNNIQFKKVSGGE